MKNTLRTPYPTYKRQQGFTLLELLVVVSVLASLAGIAAVAMDGYEQDAQEQLVHVEMKRIANAIYRFKEDTGYFPKEGMFTADNLFGASDSSTTKSKYEHQNNLGWLLSAPELYDTNGDNDTDSSDGDPRNRLPWNHSTGRGWNGPYLTIESKQLLSTQDCDLSVTGSNNSFDAIADPFERKKTYSGSDSCFLVLDEGNWVSREFAGMPYRYDTNYKDSNVSECTSSCIALISAGKNSEFNEATATDDDIVIVLRSDG
ncbi:prepilin-type N-terminal cleavage/methylation domain-containing protein [Pontibacterium sp. N1Y112]|uniref:Prepilin-type N-terminal cleavage/methylation domain-containing protein n=1 Tax=Pontibacterium sinense TaxID=2781979 RepID=A0A8J7FFY6_9GAMM|nr:prepilin-type N-terminal cleavage/methylation domain-containing protein [Pontibacterium sinense]MBE9398856.1 prepilin-type N-terminal cleavage/methylation domain-containing protein [Pontibacterium sinense]